MGGLDELLFINSAHETLWDVTTDELKSDPLSFLETVHRDDRDRVRRAVHATASGDPGGIDFRVRSPDGGWRWVHAEGRPVERNGEVVRLVGFIRDITDRREREAELRTVERRYRAIFNDPNILVGVLDPDGTVRDVNRTALDYIEASPEDVRGRPLWETPWFDSSAAASEEVQSCVKRARRGEYVAFEFDLEYPSGEPYTVEGNIRPVRDETGSVVSLIISDRDITDRKRRKRSLERALERTQIALEHTDSMIFEVDAATGSLTRHGASERFPDPDPEEATWDYYLENVVHPEDRPDHRAFYESLLQGDADRGSLLYRTLDVDDTIRWIRVIVRAIEEAGHRRLVGLARDVTEETERKHELEETRERLNLALTAGNIGIWEWRTTTNEVVWSASLQRLRGAEATDPPRTLGECLELIHPQDRDRVRAALMEAAEPDGEFGVELRLEAADDSYRWMAFRGEAIDEDGNRLLGVVSDITERRRYRRRLEQVQARTRELMHTRTADDTAALAVEAAASELKATAAGYFEPDNEGTLRAVAFADPTGLFGGPPTYPRQEDDAVGSFVWQIFEAGEVRYLPDVAADEAAPSGRPVQSAIFVPVGERGLFIASATEPNAFAEADRALIEILVTALTEALERAHREGKLRERESQIEAINELSRDAFAAERPGAVAEIGVRAATEVIGLEVTAIYRVASDGNRLEPAACIDPDGIFEGDPPSLDAGSSLAWETFEHGEPLVFDDVRSEPHVSNPDTRIESEIIVPLGDHGVLMVGSTEPAAFDDQDLTVIEILGQNLTAAFEQVTQKKALAERTERLAVQNERLDEFASIVSHDLRNPLNVATGHLELAREKGDNEHLQAIDTVLERMDVLIGNLLTLARQGESVRSFEPVDLTALASECWRTVATATATLEVTAGATIRADQQRCRQLFENLYRNAVQHAGEDVTVRVGRLKGGFFVEDDGPGIPADRREAVFDSGVSTDANGTGLGLRIVEQIVAEHGWSIEITDSSTGGARFEITDVDVTDG